MFESTFDPALIERTLYLETIMFESPFDPALDWTERERHVALLARRVALAFDVPHFFVNKAHMHSSREYYCFRSVGKSPKVRIKFATLWTLSEHTEWNDVPDDTITEVRIGSPAKNSQNPPMTHYSWRYTAQNQKGAFSSALIAALCRLRVDTSALETTWSCPLSAHECLEHKLWGDEHFAGERALVGLT